VHTARQPFGAADRLDIPTQRSMQLIENIRHVLSGRRRMWERTDNRASGHIYAQTKAVFVEEPPLQYLFQSFLLGSCLLSARLLYNGAPNKAHLKVDFTRLTFDQMLAFHARGMDLFATMYSILSQMPIPPGFFLDDMLRRCYYPAPSAPGWREEVEGICRRPKFDLFPLGCGFLRQVKQSVPPVAVPFPAEIACCLLIGEYYKVVFDTISQHVAS